MRDRLKEIDIKKRTYCFFADMNKMKIKIDEKLQRNIDVQKYKELWNKVRDLIRIMINNSDNYIEK